VVPGGPVLDRLGGFMSKLLGKLRNRVRIGGFWSTFQAALDVSISWGIQSLLGRRIGWDRFGWLEAVAYGWRIDVWFRHSNVGREIRRLCGGDRQVSVLDVGGAGAELSEILDPQRFQITCVDLRPLKSPTSRAAFVAGDGRALPFRDDSFDVVVSIDSLEHVPGNGKLTYLQEMRRLARRGVVIHCPAHSNDGRFRGNELDLEFMRRHRAAFGCTDPFTEEHLESKLPAVELISRVFPGAELRGTETGTVWLDYMIRERRPLLKYLTGIRYKLHLSRHDGVAPYHSVLATAELDAATAESAVVTAESAVVTAESAAAATSRLAA
jgi:hypothetical protein